MEYHKLVRDKIPEVIAKRGEVAVTHTANDNEYMQKLREKLKEEVDEYIKDGNIEELADVLEVIYAIFNYKKVGEGELERLREKKLKERGGFKKRVILDEIK